MKTVVPQGTGGSNPPCSVESVEGIRTGAPAEGKGARDGAVRARRRPGGSGQEVCDRRANPPCSVERVEGIRTGAPAEGKGARMAPSGRVGGLEGAGRTPVTARRIPLAGVITG